MGSKKVLVRDIENDPYELKVLQNKILEIALYFDDFCKKNDIKYFLMGGSALGAMRHNGFIPWDDDYDVFLDYKNYQKFLSKIDLIDKKRFHFQRENSYENPFYFSKLRMNGTTFIEDNVQKHDDMHQGIYIDIMCLYPISNKQSVQKRQYYACALLKTKALIRTGYKTDNKKKKVLLFLSRILVNGLTEKLLQKYVKKYVNKETDYYGHFFGRAKFKNAVYPKKCFSLQRYVDFETVKLPVPNDVEEYLTIRFGNKYMDTPDQKTRDLYPSHSSLWDVNKDYTEYLKQGDGNKRKKYVK